MNQFNKLNDEEVKFHIFNQAERKIVGVAMLPDKLMIRRNEITGEIYYVYFSKETIKKIMEKFMEDQLLNKFNVEHGDKFLDGLNVVESWIVEDETFDKQKIYGFNYPIGSWILITKVKEGRDDIWKKITNGELKAYSVQGWFKEKNKFSSAEMILNEIRDIIKYG